MDVELMILGFLLSGPKTGYRLNAIAGKLLLFYNVGLNQIYPTLRKLEAAGCVEKEIVYQTGKPNKHLYTATEKGRRYFTKKMTSPPEQTDINFPFLVRTLFFRFLASNQVEKVFQAEIQSLEEQLANLETSRSTVEEQADENGRFIYKTALAVLEGLKASYAGELKRRKSENKK